MLARACSSCRVPSTRLSRIRRPTTTAVDTSPITRLTTTTAMSMMFIGSRSWTSAISQIDGGFSAAIAFGPYWPSRVATSALPSPAAGSVLSPAATSAPSRACGGGPSPPTAVVAVASSIRTVASSAGSIPRR